MISILNSEFSTKNWEIREKYCTNAPTVLGGWPKLLTPQEERLLGRYIQTGEVSYAATATIILEENTGQLISKWTVMKN